MTSTVNVIVNRALISLLPEGIVAQEANGGLADILNSTRKTFDLPNLLGMATQLVTQHQSGAFDESSSLDDWHMFFSEEEQRNESFGDIAAKVKKKISSNFGVNLLISLAISLLPASTVKKMLQVVFSSISENEDSIDSVPEIVVDYLKPALIKHLAPEAATQLLGFASSITKK